jgi:lycopene cyclase domain-containing protein
MTYALFLAVFLVIPIAILLWLLHRSLCRPHLIWIGLLMAVALVYTTPWDNYLVANRIWWYHPKLVTGITIGWVPIEEYTFFLLQPLMSGLWFLFISRSVPDSEHVESRPHLRLMSVIGCAALWLVAVILLSVGWKPATYLALMLAWGLPPVMLQMGTGADILWTHWRKLLLTILPTTLYLTAADSLAINGGTWTINPMRSLGVMIGGVLPLEELLFFLLTNTLITFAMTLLSEASMRGRARMVFAQMRALLLG